MSELAIMVLRFFSCLFVFFVASKTTIAYDLFSSHKKYKKPQNGPDMNGLLKSTSSPLKAGSADGMVRKLMFPSEQK